MSETMDKLDFRAVLHDKLYDLGLADQLKSELRAKLLRYMDNQAKLSQKQFLGIARETTTQFASSSSNHSNSLVQRAIHVLIKDYLEKQKMDFSLSVFLPESGQNSKNNFISNSELLEILGVQELKTNEKKSQNTPLLLQILSSIKSSKCKPHERAIHTQTEKTAEDALLKRIDSTISTHGNSSFSEKQKLVLDFEKQITEFKSKLERELKNEHEQELERFKKNQLSHVTLEQQEKYQALLQTKIQEHEKQLQDHKAHYNTLLESQVQSFQQREAFLNEQHAQVQARAIEVANKKILEETLLRQELKLKLEQSIEELNDLKQKLQSMEVVIEDAKRLKETCSAQIQQEVARLRVKMHEDYMTKLADTQIEKSKLDADRKSLDILRLETDRLQREARSQLTSLETLRHENALLKSDNQVIKKENYALKLKNKEFSLQLGRKASNTGLEFEIHSLKKQLLESQKTTEDREKKYEEFITSMSSSDKKIAQELTAVKKSEALWMKECHELVKKMNTEITKKEALKRKIEFLQIRNAELSSELIHTKSMLTNRSNMVSPLKNKSNSFILPDPHDVLVGSTIKAVEEKLSSLHLDSEKLQKQDEDIYNREEGHSIMSPISTTHHSKLNEASTHQDTLSLMDSSISMEFLSEDHHQQHDISFSIPSVPVPYQNDGVYSTLKPSSTQKQTEKQRDVAYYISSPLNTLETEFTNPKRAVAENVVLPQEVLSQNQTDKVSTTTTVSSTVPSSSVEQTPHDSNTLHIESTAMAPKDSDKNEPQFTQNDTFLKPTTSNLITRQESEEVESEISVNSLDEW